jgi:hypothetical protein
MVSSLEMWLATPHDMLPRGRWRYRDLELGKGFGESGVWTFARFVWFGVSTQIFGRDSGNYWFGRSHGLGDLVQVPRFWEDIWGIRSSSVQKVGVIYYSLRDSRFRMHDYRFRIREYGSGLRVNRLRVRIQKSGFMVQGRGLQIKFGLIVWRLGLKVKRLRFTVCSLWFRVYGLWFMVYGLWSRVYHLKFRV